MDAQIVWQFAQLRGGHEPLNLTQVHQQTTTTMLTTYQTMLNPTFIID